MAKDIGIKLKFHSVLLAIMLTVTAHNFAQQKTKNNTLKQSIALIDVAFQENNIENFNRLVSLKSVQDFYASVLRDSLKKVSGKSEILSIHKDSAYVSLSGILLYGNSGDETNYSGNYTGIYKFERIAGSWILKNRINIDRLNQIKKHNLRVAVIPGKSIRVKDTLTIDVLDSFGFAMKLNHSARLEKVTLNNTQAEFGFSSGLLWIKAKIKNGQQLIIDYTIEVEKDDKNTNSAYFSEAYGHLRNQYFWHPFFSFSSPNDRADFSLYCTIPKEYDMATSLVQNEVVVGDLRIIKAHSESPTFGLSMYYDRDWEPATLKKDQIDLVIYATKDFLPGKNELYAEFSKNYDTLQQYFGKPLSNYFGIVQDRSNGSGWKNRSNNIVVAGQKGGPFMTDKPHPRATFGHEVAHGWTSPMGPATNFLMEGWATYAESVILSSAYGDSIVAKFFKIQKQNYIKGEYNGRISLWEDYSNSGVSYSKGAWLFYMLADQLGEKNLSVAMTNFIQSGNQSIQSFINQLSRIAGNNMEPFLRCWLKSREIPALNIQRSAAGLIIHQHGDIFIFPLEIQIRRKDGTYLTKVVRITNQDQEFKMEEDFESYTIDPNNKLLCTIK